MVVVETKWESINDKTYTIEVDDKELKKLCKKYGIYGIDWYFIDTNTIKYFDDERQCWDYTHAFIPTKIV